MKMTSGEDTVNPGPHRGDAGPSESSSSWRKYLNFSSDKEEKAESEASTALVPQPSTSSSWSGSWIEKWFYPEGSSAAPNQGQQPQGAPEALPQAPAPTEDPDLITREIIQKMREFYPWDPENPLIRGDKIFPGGRGISNIRPMTVEELKQLRDRLNHGGKKSYWAKELRRRIRNSALPLDVQSTAAPQRISGRTS